MRKGIAAFVGALLLSGAATASAQPTTIDSVEYLRRLAGAAAIARSSAIKPSPARMDEVRRALGLPVTVNIRGRDVRVGRDRFLEELKGDRGEDFLRAANHLDRLESTTQAAIVTSVPSLARVAGAVEKAYSGIQLEVGPLQRLRQAILNFLSEQLARAIFYLTANRGVGSLLAWTVVVAILAAVVALVVRRIRLVPEKASPIDRIKKERVDWEAEAASAMARGDYAGATRARYRALLEALAYRGAIDDIPSLTAGEARGATSKTLPNAFQAVADATAVFERVAYGRAPLAPGELEAMKEAESVVRAA
jgi:hypothetical protein